MSQIVAFLRLWGGICSPIVVIIANIPIPIPIINIPLIAVAGIGWI